MTKVWVHGVGHSPVCQILLQIVVRAVIKSSPPAWVLSTPADFPFFNDFAEDGMVVLCVCLRTVQYIWISVIVQLKAVLNPSVQYLSFSHFHERFGQ